MGWLVLKMNGKGLLSWDWIGWAEEPVALHVLLAINTVSRVLPHLGSGKRKYWKNLINTYSHHTMRHRSRDRAATRLCLLGWACAYMCACELVCELAHQLVKWLVILPTSQEPLSFYNENIESGEQWALKLSFSVRKQLDRLLTKLSSSYGGDQAGGIHLSGRRYNLVFMTSAPCKRMHSNVTYTLCVCMGSKW